MAKKKSTLQDEAEEANIIRTEKMYKAKYDTDTSNTPGAVTTGGKKNKNIKNKNNSKFSEKKQKNQKN